MGVRGRKRERERERNIVAASSIRRGYKSIKKSV
jgi:hypothetical protein